MTRLHQIRGAKVSSDRGLLRSLDELERFLGDLYRGVEANDFRRLFHAEAGAAYRALERERGGTLPQHRLLRVFYRVRVVFLGLSYKLSPPRRVVFLASLGCALLGLIDWGPGLQASVLTIDASPFWFLLAIAGLLFLLALELVDQVRVRDELEVARQLQRDLLPSRTPEVSGYEFAHSYRTANEVGGDYYDFMPLPDGRLALIVGDASGHGMAAGLLMAIANATLRVAIDTDPSPASVLTVLNRALLRTGDRRVFMTLFYGVLDPRSGRLEYANAGHPYPLLRRRAGGIEELRTGTLPLGWRADLAFVPQPIDLAPGDLLVLLSDGLPEAVDRNQEAFGYQRVADLLLPGGSADAVLQRITATLARHVGDQMINDDWSLVVLAVTTPEDPPRA